MSHSLSAAIASSPDDKAAIPHPQATRLADLEAGASAVIGSIGAESELRLRMHALGLIPGRRVQVVRKAPFHGPMQVRSGHTCLLIRLEEARSINLEQYS
jgi:Fe2+ transport system protein FeoA